MYTRASDVISICQGPTSKNYYLESVHNFGPKLGNTSADDWVGGQVGGRGGGPWARVSQCLRDHVVFHSQEPCLTPYVCTVSSKTGERSKVWLYCLK